MLSLPLGISFSDQRTAQPIAGIRQAEQALALAHTQLHVILFLQTRRETLSIPEVGLHAGDGGRLPHPATHFLQLLGRESGGASRMVAFGQTRQALEVETSHPVDQGARRVPKQFGSLLATHARSHEQDAVQSVIISGILMTVDFLLEHGTATLRR